MHGGQQLTGVFAAGPGGALAAPVVDVAELVNAAVALPGIGDHGRARLHMVGDEGVQRQGGRVRHRRHPTPAQPLRLPDLDSDAGQHLLASGPAAPQPGLLTAEEGLVHLHRPGQPLPARTYRHRAQPVQHRPRGLIGADLQRPLHAQRRDPTLVAGEQPAGGEPHRQRCPRSIEDRARGHRGPVAAAGALEPAVTQPPATPVLAVGADEPGRPAQPLQVVQAVRVGPEPGLQLAHGPRTVHARPRVIHELRLLRLDG